MVNKSVVHGRPLPNYSNAKRSTSMPIYLYVKTHNKTGLKYLGKTISSNPHKYKGSGTYWLSHIRKHGNDVSTEIIKECLTIDEIFTWGIYYSNLWNIVESNTWANLKPESGDGGSVSGRRQPQTLETKLKISASMKGRPAQNKGKKQKHKIRIDNPKLGIVDSKLKGRVRPKLQCPHCGKLIDEANYHRYHGDKCKSL